MPEHDQKRQLKGLVGKEVQLTPYQATKLNAWIRTDPEKAREMMRSIGQE